MYHYSLSSYSEKPRIDEATTIVVFNQSRLIKYVDYQLSLLSGESFSRIHTIKSSTSFPILNFTFQSFIEYLRQVSSWINDPLRNNPLG